MLKKEIIKLRAALPMLLASLSADRRAFMDSNSNSDRLSNTLTSTDSHSKNAIYNTASLINLDNPFFKSLRENDRSGTSYNVPSQVWTITPKRIQTILEKKQGLNLFLGLVENANSLTAVPTAEEYRSAYSMLLNKGSICLGIDILAAALKSL